MSNNKQSSLDNEFVPYEEALALKELGYRDPCFGLWWFNQSIHKANEEQLEIRETYYFQLFEYCLLAPTFSQAFRWFRENNLSDSCVCRYQSRDDGGIYFYYVINHDYGIEETKHFKEGFCSYEEAELACLKKLIEIVKETNK